MGISGAVDWWEEWQLRILVLGSLFVQYLLLCSAPFRKVAIPSWYRSIIWLAYVGSDALAIYALATLFNRHRKDYGSANNNSVLEVKPWALKRASINSLVSSSDPTPRMASMVGKTILLEECVQEARDFVQGDKYHRSQGESDAVDLEHIHVPQAQGEAYELEDNHHHQAQGEGNAAKLDLNHIPQINGKADVKMRVIKIREKERKFDLETRKIFVDLALSYPDRLDFLKYIWVLDKKKTCVFLRRGLFHTFDILYSRQTFNGHMELLREDAAAAQIRKEAATVRKGSAAVAAEEESAAERSSDRKKRISTRKESAAERSSSRKKRIGTRKESAAAGAAEEVSFLDFFSYILWAAAVYLPFTAIGLLHKSHREAYDVNDVKVTYALC
ncbi:hypothetical protein CFC21_095124 [Triticum aestivum]|uniref:DUF4220 domain-containing protein n=2 Tax=Triticum aestivum TaxID=4565 RepID=A0A9R1MX52_WHEAT|nr:hypothetical protein CFC21_095124 [Triticum aestivum]